MNGNTVGIIAVGVLSLIGAMYSAKQARKTNTATVDVRIFEMLQKDVVQLQERVDKLRRELHEAQDETDVERRKRRGAEVQIEAITDVIERMIRTMIAANIPVPEEAQSWLRFPKQTAPTPD